MRGLCLLILASFGAFADINKGLQEQLIEMEKQDQHIREQLRQVGWENAPKALKEQLALIDQHNTTKLKQLLKNRDWFALSEVGKTGIGAAFLIIQHSPDDEFKESMLPVLKQSYLNGEGVSGQKVALLTDRVLIGKGKKQRYGTQADVSNGQIVFKPISEPDTVDARRAEMKMPPLSFYKRLLEEMYGIKDHPDIDLN